MLYNNNNMYRACHEAAMIDNHQIYSAIHFLFPHLYSTYEEYIKLSDYIKNSYLKIGAAVLYAKSEDFVKLINKLHLPDIGNKEVIVNRSHVLATYDYRIRPRSIYEK